MIPHRSALLLLALLPAAAVGQSPAPTHAFEVAPAPTARRSMSAGELAALTQPLARWFAAHPERAAYLQVDRPLYRPGETIQLRAWNLPVRTLDAGSTGGTVQLLDPRGGVVATLDGVAGSFGIPKDAPGGAWTLRLSAGGKVLTERPVVVRAVQVPKLKTTLELGSEVRRPGDRVEATVTVARNTGAPLANTPLSFVLQVDGVATPVDPVTTDAQGRAVVRFTLPARLSRADVTLTVLVTDGGITESVSRPVPVLVDRLVVAAFPEGGDLVRGLPSRVFVEVTDTLGAPVAARGSVRDDRGVTVASWEAGADGRGAFTLRPEAGRRYTLLTERERGVDELALPTAADDGCVLRTFADVDGLLPAVRAQVACSTLREVTVVGMQREQVLDVARVEAGPDEAAVVYLEPSDPALGWAPGVARVTVLDGQRPLAERVVFRNRLSRLQVSLTADRDSYAPGQPVVLTLTTTDRAGRAVPADLALSVVDDALLTFADDHTPGIVSRALLAPEVPGEVPDADHFFDAGEPDAGPALDRLLATRGWRRFAWEEVFAPPQPTRYRQAVDMDFEGLAVEERMEADALAPRPAPPAAMAAPVGMAAGAVVAEKAKAASTSTSTRTAATVVRENAAPLPPPVMRTDFRDTVYWAPSVRTDRAGHAQVTFPMTDAVGTFRVRAEGAGGGVVGAGEAELATRLPLALDVKLPEAMAEGDRPLLPIVVDNGTSGAAVVRLEADWGGLLAPRGAQPGGIEVAGGGRGSVYLPLEVVASAGRGKVTVTGRSGEHTDAFARDIEVTPRGFPQERSEGGVVRGTATETLVLDPWREGTLEARVKVFPGAVASVVSGLEGMLRQPGGCFEQTSSTNYPNVMILRYLEQTATTAPEVQERARALLVDGYARLTSFESRSGGFEWFGADPGHEALTAYGILQFVDMKRVLPRVDQAMVDRTAQWLIDTRRNGKGGYLRNARALDSFGRASEIVTDAYVTWSLVEAGYAARLGPELAALSRLGGSTSDPYLLALVTASLGKGNPATARPALDALLARQAADGSFPGADHSVTRSGGYNLLVETTALAALGIMNAGGSEESLRRAVEWLEANREGSGAWGATQATVLALRALTTYAATHAAPATDGSLVVRVNGQRAGELRYFAGAQGALELSGFAHLLRPGQNRVEVTGSTDTPMPMVIEASYRTERPATATDVAVDLETRLPDPSMRMGESTRLTATVRNRTGDGQPMTLARIGVPGGLSAQEWQLQKLKDEGVIDFYETRPLEVTVYWRALAPRDVRTVALDLVATVPGTWSAPASSAYLYYTDDRRDWTDGYTVEVAP